MAPLLVEAYVPGDRLSDGERTVEVLALSEGAEFYWVEDEVTGRAFKLPVVELAAWGPVGG